MTDTKKPDLLESVIGLFAKFESKQDESFNKNFRSHVIAAVQKQKPDMFVINGFYMSMRDKYCKPGAGINYYVLSWDESKLSWKNFRGEVLGATDPLSAGAGSMRRHLFENWQALGLASLPDIGDNGLHASASPMEALFERMNWLGADWKADPFGQALLAAGIPAETVESWKRDPQVPFEGSNRSLFDLFEDHDASATLAKAQKIAGVTHALPTFTTNIAFVFIKPAARTEKAIAYCVSEFGSKGFTVGSSGVLDHKKIEDDKLIDNHYYSIANKATLTTPDKLNPGEKVQEEFAVKFGITWTDAIKQGIVFNALEACQKLAIDGKQLDTIWAVAKETVGLQKFGGGFYCGKVQG